MIEVEVQSGDINTAIRFLKKVVGQDGIHGAVKRRLAFPKKSLRKREKAAVAARRRLKLEGKNRRYEEYHLRRKRLNPVDLRQQEMAGLVRPTSQVEKEIL